MSDVNGFPPLNYERSRFTGWTREQWVALLARLTCGYALAAEEIAASAAWLAGVEPGQWAFAYPYGGLSPMAPHLLTERGFAAALTSRDQLQQRDPYFIGRLDGQELATAAPVEIN